MKLSQYHLKLPSLEIFLLDFVAFFGILWQKLQNLNITSKKYRKLFSVLAFKMALNNLAFCILKWCNFPALHHPDFKYYPGFSRLSLNSTKRWKRQVKYFYSETSTEKGHQLHIFHTVALSYDNPIYAKREEKVEKNSCDQIFTLLSRSVNSQGFFSVSCRCSHQKYDVISETKPYMSPISQKGRHFSGGKFVWM